MKITTLKQQIKNPDRVSIFVDGKYEFSLSLDEVVKYKITNGQELNKTDLKKFKKISEDGKLRARALEWLLNRPHSTKEFKDYLYRKKADPEFGETLREEFSAKGYLDDIKFAAWFIDLQTRKNKSRRAIRMELMKKGISGEQLDIVMEGQEINEEEAIKAIMDKKKNLTRYKNDPVKLKQHLLSKGFSYEAISQAFKGKE